MGVSVVVADDHPFVRCGIRITLANAGFSVIGEAADGREALSLVERLNPMALTLDLMMPGLGGLEALRIIRERSPKTRIVVATMYQNSAFVTEALKWGASGYVVKSGSLAELVHALREAVNGRRFLSSPITQIAIDALVEQAKSGPANPHDALTPREREVLQLVAEGKTSREIGVRLHISPRTADNHRATLMRKLGLRNMPDLIRHAIRQGLIPFED